MPRIFSITLSNQIIIYFLFGAKLLWGLITDFTFIHFKFAKSFAPKVKFPYKAMYYNILPRSCKHHELDILRQIWITPNGLLCLNS